MGGALSSSKSTLNAVQHNRTAVVLKARVETKGNFQKGKVNGYLIS